MMGIKRKHIELNLLFWHCYFLYEWLANAALYNEYKRYFISASVYVPITCIATYYTIHILIKRFYLRGNKTSFWFLLLVSIAAFGIIRRACNYFFVYPLYTPVDVVHSVPFLFLPKVVIEAVSIYLIVAVYTMTYFMQAWYEQQRITQALQKDKAEAQLELLKSQVHPHFIFNTLNNIYSLSLQNVPKTSDLIYRLSALLSYMLYDSRQKVVPVSKEIEYLNNYIELEKVRYGERLDVSINQYNKVEGFKISPFLLLPLVENSFKHGVCNNTDCSWIRIDLSVQDEWLTVKIENSKTDIERKNRLKNGIGLENVKRRLEILYPGRHEFKVLDEEQSFLTILRVKSWNNEDKVYYN